MLQEIEQLLILQDRDQKIRALKSELKAAPTERKEFESKLAASLRQLDAVKLRGKEIEVERKKLENEAQSKRDMIAKYQTQKFQTRKNEEFQALTNEIARFEGEIQKLEDRELELMENAEQMKATIAAAEKEAAATKEQVQRQLVHIEEKEAAIQAQLTELEAERAKLATGVEEDLLDTYDRLFSSKGNNAVVPLEHEVCMGCHMKLTSQTAVKVKSRRQVVHCEQCGRILYYEI
jgi:predicted  nucleic acid-binding Zn-ribbon protein